MKPERWPRIEAALDELLELRRENLDPGDERIASLEQELERLAGC